MKNQKLLNTLTLLSLVFTFFLGFIPQLPIKDAVVVAWMSGITMYLVQTLTAWKQYVSQIISNTAIRATLFLAIIATVGGLNDLFDVVPVSDEFNTWARIIITGFTALLNLFSAYLFPQDTPVVPLDKNTSAK